jgi:hypothetical protein
LINLIITFPLSWKFVNFLRTEGVEEPFTERILVPIVLLKGSLTMPKENTHLLFAYELLEEFHEHDILRDISDNIRHYLLGSISPDIFYYSKAKSLIKISETLHGKTGQPTNIPIIAMLKDAEGPEDIAFIMGYITHCALDIAFHPTIYYLSGNYYDEDPVKRLHAVYMHRHLETCMDNDLKNSFRFHKIIRSALLKGHVYEKIISRDFAVDSQTIRHVLRRQIISNFLFTYKAAYWLFGTLTRLGLLEDSTLLGLFYGDTTHGDCLPQNIMVKDIITGEDLTTTVAELFSQARGNALSMMKAAYDFWKGIVDRDELLRVIPGLSLDTGRLKVPPSSIRYTKEDSVNLC